MVVTGDLLGLSLSAFLDALADEDPAPGGGSAAAIAVTMAAGLCAKAARASPDWPEARAAVAQAEQLRRRTAPLAQSDAEAYEEALAALHLPSELEAEVRNMALGQVLARAAEIPLVIAEASADAASLAALVAERGTLERRGDAVTAALLAEAAARAAADLVVGNLTVAPDDPRAIRARSVAEAASTSAREALASAQT
ncbi:MAG TPA: cyclodeaminase/cyclohydrolase family protein [Gaiellaceae bacterium]|nr:cyclodeaminase/cyclohydrolase family protein [Gaiellaceae bacterium]